VSSPAPARTDIVPPAGLENSIRKFSPLARVEASNITVVAGGTVNGFK